MQNNNPLRIFTQSEINDLSHDTLIKYRKQKLLLFQMTDKYKIKLNGHEVDKNTVIAIFEDLEKTLDSHLLQFKVPEIQTFLSSPDMSTFHLLLTVDFNSMNEVDRTSVMQNIAAKINRQLGRDIKNRKIGPNNVKWITEFTSKYLEHDLDIAYGNVYAELNDYVSYIEEEYPQPYMYGDGTKLYEEVEKLLNGQFYDALSALPNMFEPIKISFAKWCHNNVLQKAFARTTEFRKFKNSTLVTLQKAMYIAANYFQPKHHRDNARLITSHLSGSGSSSGGGNSGCGGIGLVLGIIIFIIKFSILFRNCGNDYDSSRYRVSSRNTTYNASERDKQAYDDVMKMIAEKKRKVKEDRGSSTPVSTETSSTAVMEEDNPNLTALYPRGGSSVQSVKVVKDYSGVSKLALNAKVKRIEHKDDVVEVYFSCDALPMYHQSYARLIPDEVKNKYAGKVQDAVFIFEPRGLSKASTHVSLKIDLVRRGKYPATSFGFVKKTTEQAKRMNVKKIKTADFKFKGNIKEYDIGETTAKKSVNFNISYDKAKKSYVYNQRGSSNKIITLDSISKVGKSYIESENLGNTRYASLVNNIKIIQDKYLRQASIYTIPESSYCLSSASTSNQTMKVYSKDGILKMYITSKGDGNTYAELIMDKSQVNYIINEEGYITTVQQVTYDRSTKTIERILMTR